MKKIILSLILCAVFEVTIMPQQREVQAETISEKESHSGAKVLIDEEILANFFIQAELYVPERKFSTYQTVRKKFDENKLIEMLMSEHSLSDIQIEKQENGIVDVNCQEERLYLSPGMLRYIKDEDTDYLMQLVGDNKAIESLREENLSFLTRENAEEMTRDFLAALELGGIPDEPHIEAYTKETLEELQKNLYDNDEHFRGLCENGKISIRESFSAKDEIYVVKYSFLQDGLPVFGPDEPDIYSMGGIDSAPPALPMEAIFYISESGIQFVQLYNVIDGAYTVSEEKEIILEEGIKDSLRKLYGDVILTEENRVTNIWLEYIPLRNQADIDSVEMVPAWCCEFETENSENDDWRYAERFHAITGEVLA